MWQQGRRLLAMSFPLLSTLHAVDEGEVVSIPPGTVCLALANCFCLGSRKMDAALGNGGATCLPGQPSTSTSQTLE